MCTIVVLPDTIGELIHLQYLDLSGTKIKGLPDSVCGLYNLQTLELSDCFYLTMLPENFHHLVNLRYLDIRRTGLEGMPRKIGAMKNLQFLTDFVIGKDTCISDLGGLVNLDKSLANSGLENTGRVSEARIKNKQYLEHLELSWNSRYCSPVPLGVETEILDNLQPQTNLESLTIRNYSGLNFPVWVGHNSYHNMVSVSLYCCDCFTLPPFGQLPSLKHLIVHGFHNLVTTGPEFYGNDGFSSMSSFASLESLKFTDLENCLSFQAEDCVFPRLCVLELGHCPLLVGDLPHHLPSLAKLVIIGCKQLVSSLSSCPVIKELEIYESEKLALREIPISLHTVRVSGCNLVDHVFKSMMHTENSLEHLDISDCSTALSFAGGCLPTSLKTLVLKNCSNVEAPMLQTHMALETFKINNSWGSVEYFPMDVFPFLKFLYIGCENLASLSVAAGTLGHLDSIAIIQCPKFVSFPQNGLVAPCLRSITISRCESSQSLPNHMKSLLPALTELSIIDCPEIESFLELGWPSTLSSLVINNCLKLFARRMEWNLPSLTSLTISGIYDMVESFPDHGLLPDTLTYMSIEKILMIKLDCQELQRLTSLKYLWIVNCPVLESLTEVALPASLVKLTVRNCPFMEEKCHMKSREIWPKIAHIRNIRIGDKWIT